MKNGLRSILHWRGRTFKGQRAFYAAFLQSLGIGGESADSPGAAHDIDDDDDEEEDDKLVIDEEESMSAPSASNAEAKDSKLIVRTVKRSRCSSVDIKICLVQDVWPVPIKLEDSELRSCLNRLYPPMTTKTMDPHKKYVCATCKSSYDLMGLFLHMKQVSPLLMGHKLVKMLDPGSIVIAYAREQQ